MELKTGNHVRDLTWKTAVAALSPGEIWIKILSGAGWWDTGLRKSILTTLVPLFILAILHLISQ